jgi:hypothetical protein
VLALEQKEQNRLLKDYENGTLSSQKELRLAVRELQNGGVVSEAMPLYDIFFNAFIKAFIKKLEKFMITQDTLTHKQQGLVTEALRLLKEI